MALNGLIAALPPPPPGRTGWPWTEETDPAVYREPLAAGAWPAITIVCPSFRQGGFIEETIRSVLLQNYPRLEFMVLDAGSEDVTPMILQKYARWLAYCEAVPDRGQSHALNKGYARATGELYGWINSDDYYLPGAFAAAARAWRPGRRALYYGDWLERVGDGPGLTLHRERPCFAFQVAVGGRTLPSHATFWPAAVHQRFNEALHFTLDAELFKRLAASGVKPRHVPHALAVFRQHGAAKSSTIVDVAHAETAAWSRAQAWPTHGLWRLSRLMDRVSERLRRR
jgi:cellulose synthase/poly-beta-1,6-N-acetylglucosamine synthase-like glycosyltransferase